jgi:hypothetical protein
MDHDLANKLNNAAIILQIASSLAVAAHAMRSTRRIGRHRVPSQTASRHAVAKGAMFAEYAFDRAATWLVRQRSVATGSTGDGPVLANRSACCRLSVRYARFPVPSRVGPLIAGGPEGLTASERHGLGRTVPTRRYRPGVVWP